MANYNFKTKPFDHQMEAFEISKDEPFYGYLMDMGTGKTKVTIDNICYLYEKGKIDAVLILAPKGMFHQWAQDSDLFDPNIMREWEMHAWDQAKEDGWVYVWDNSGTKGNTTRQRDILQRDNALSILVMNTEAMSTPKGVKFADKFMKSHDSCFMAVDEATLIKNHKAKRTRSIRAVGGSADYRRILTGTPITQGPLDLFGMMSFLSAQILGKSFYPFRARYAILKEQFMAGRSFKVVVGYTKLEELKARIAPWNIRVDKNECLDLPDKIYMKRDVPLGPTQQKLYDQMRDYAVAILDNRPVVTAPLAITQMMRLRQILCGYMKVDGQDKPVLIKDSQRFKILEGVVDELAGKIVIWCPFRACVEEVAAGLKKKFGNDSVIMYYGGVKNRSELQDQFNDPNSSQRFFVGTPQTGKYGLNFTCCCYIVRYGMDYDLDAVLQSEDRIQGIGRGKSVLDEATGKMVKLNPVYIDLVAPNTIDIKIREALIGKKTIADMITGDQWRGFLNAE